MAQTQQTPRGTQGSGPTTSAPEAPPAGNSASTGAGGVPATTVAGTPNPQTTGAGEGGIRRGMGPAAP